MADARRGPIPKPTALKVLRGTNKRHINDDEPKTGDGKPVCPDEANDEVREIWDYTMSQLELMSLAASPDRDMLYAYCEAVWAHRRASEVIHRDGILVPGQLGPLVKNPALQVQRDAASVMRYFGLQFGLTPSSRSTIRTGAAQVPKPDKDEKSAGRLLAG